MATRPRIRTIQGKLVLLGDIGTGKTSLVLRLVKGKFSESQESTIGAAFYTQVISLDEATVKLEIWDTAGQERYHSLTPMYYRNAAAAMIVYDISNKDTFVRAKKWVQELQRQGGLASVVMALVGNKVDLEPLREVSTEEAYQYAQENRIYFVETSAKSATNINDIFCEVAKRVSRYGWFSNPAHTGTVLHSEPPDISGTRSSCCSS